LQLNKILQLLEIVSVMLREIEEAISIEPNDTKESEQHKILLSKAHKMSKEVQDLSEEKLKCTVEIKKLIESKYQEFNFDNDVQNALDMTPSDFNPEPGTSTPFNHQSQSQSTSGAGSVPKKRGRKPKNVFETSQQRNDSVESSDLMMLADVAVIKKEEEEEAANVRFGKLPVTKHLRKHGKSRMGRKSKNAKHESETDSDTASAEPDENEPLYCLCNRVSFGLMVECSNDACPIEW
jgi:inhibitor of growth protein 1